MATRSRFAVDECVQRYTIKEGANSMSATTPTISRLGPSESSIKRKVPLENKIEVIANIANELRWVPIVMLFITGQTERIWQKLRARQSGTKLELLYKKKMAEIAFDHKD